MKLFIKQILATGLLLAGCSKAEPEKSNAVTAGATAAPAAPAPGDQIGNSAAAPQGDCPEGYACTRVLFPENARICMKPGETLAPACDASDKCPDIPKADCVDTGTLGKVCTQLCKV